MKRPGIQRKTPLKRGTKRLKTRKVSRRFAKLRDEAFRKWVASRWCFIGEQCWGEGIDACHVKTRGAGGADLGNLVPMCRAHHTEQHTLGIRSFQRKHGVDMKAEAQRLAEFYAATYIDLATKEAV